MSDDLNRNARWARLIAEELRRAGVSHVVLCPGSRNSPLLFALAEAFGEDALSHVDERSAGFLALGLIRAIGSAVAVCVTSGSAVANLLPAVCEAAAAELPLIVISADRPWEAHDSSAPQTMPQRGIFSAFTVAELALGEPTDDDRALRALRMQVSRLAQTISGPAHLNVPLRDPLPPLADPTWQPPEISREALHGRPEGSPMVSRHPAGQASPLVPRPWLKPGLRGLIVVGALSEPEPASALSELAQAIGFPVLADAASQVRHDEVPHLIITGDALLDGVLKAAEPELIIQIGPMPLTRTVYEWLDRQRCPWITFATAKNQDSLHRAWLTIEGGWGDALGQLGEWLHTGDQTWRERWVSADAQARAGLAIATDKLGWGESLVVRTAINAPGFAFVHLASSMAIRHANLHLLPSPRPVYSNRGVNGIDGTLGTFLGECFGHSPSHSGGQPQPGLLVIGDLAFLHDLPALAGVPGTAATGAIVVLDNGGGGIFDFLPVAQVPDYQRLVRTTHRLDFSGAATLFGLIYHACCTPSELATALAAAASSSSLHLIHCQVRDRDAVAQHRHLIRVAAGLDA